MQSLILLAALTAPCEHDVCRVTVAAVIAAPVKVVVKTIKAKPVRSAVRKYKPVRRAAKRLVRPCCRRTKVI